MSALPLHPFISFDFDARSLQTRTWFLLGEALSKCKHLAGTPLKPSFAQHLSSVFLARGALATTAIEGNTLSEEQAHQILLQGSAGVPESREYLEQEVKNILAALAEIDSALSRGERLPIDPDRVKYLNRIAIQGIPDKPEVVPGEYRQHDVVAGGYRAPHWDEVPRLVDEFTTWLARMRSEVNPSSTDENRFVNAVLAAVLTHLYIAWIHPFGNGNGRTARLLEVQILSESGLVPIVATNLLSDHYNKTRTQYYLALDEAQKDVGTFIAYAVRGFVDELREQIGVVRDQSLRVHWESYVYEVFRSKPTTAARDRQRLLALSLPGGKVITTQDIVTLTPELAARYAVTGERTPARDLNDLVKLGLVEKTGRRRYRVQHEIIQAFLPPVAPSESIDT